MSDRRPYAKIDTGYMLNPKWFQVERHLRANMATSDANANALAMAKRIASALRLAREAHLASILYCAQSMTDGLFPVRAIKALVTVQDEDEEAAITALFEVGLWINHPEGMAEVHDYLEHQTPAELAGKRSEAGRKGAQARWQTDGKSHSVANGKTDGNRNAEEKRREEKELLATRADVRSVFDAFNDSLEARGVKKKKPTDTAIRAVRLMIDTDGHTVDQILRCIEWVTASDFWSTTVLSLPTLRKKYDTLRLQAQRDQKSTTEQSSGWDAIPWAGELDDDA